jgi:ubiquinone/menaquinone biosynthesis C-methylase UbiE
MAGVGTIHGLARPGIVTTGLEIEPEWADQHPMTIEGDATAMPFGDDSFELVMFSPPYGNRMADQFVSKDGTYRVTYYHFLNRRLHENSAAGMHFGPDYCKTMRSILVECKRVNTPDGFVVINVSNFIKNGEVIDVIQWYIDSMIDLGYRVMKDREVTTRRMRYGANHKLRVGSEHVITFKLRRY